MNRKQDSSNAKRVCYWEQLDFIPKDSLSQMSGWTFLGASIIWSYQEVGRILFVVQLPSHITLFVIPWIVALPCPSLSPRVCSNACPLSRWCHPTISSSVGPFLSCPQSFPGSGSFPMSQFFTSGGKSIGTSASVFAMNIQAWFPLGLTGLISLQSKGLSRVFSSTTIWKHQFLALSLLYGQTLTSIYDYWKNHSCD